MEVFLEELDLDDPVLGELPGDAPGLVAQLANHLVVLDETPRDQLRRRDLSAVGQGHGRHDDQHAVLGEPAAVAQRDVLDVSDAQPVHEGDAGVDPVDDARRLAGRDLDD